MARFGRSRAFVRARGPLILVGLLAVAVIAGLVDVASSWGTTVPASAAESVATASSAPSTPAPATAAPATGAPAVKTEYVSVPAPAKPAACSTAKARRHAAAAGTTDRCSTRGSKKSRLLAAAH